MTAQFGVMFRLTYYEYSWDIMEPIAYFLGSATGIFMYLFYMATQRGKTRHESEMYLPPSLNTHSLLSRVDFTYETLHGETFSRRRLNLYKKKGYDINRYLELGAQRRSLLAEIDGVIKKYDKK